jgi:hypothetical protein
MLRRSECIQPGTTHSSYGRARYVFGSGGDSGRVWRLLLLLQLLLLLHKGLHDLVFALGLVRVAASRALRLCLHRAVRRKQRGVA